MSRKILLALLLAGGLSLPAISAVSADGADIDDTWFFEQPDTDGWHGIKFADRQANMDRFSYLKRLETYHGKPCANTSEGRCATTPTQEFSAILPMCASSSETNCLVGFGSIDASGKRTPATFSRGVPTSGDHDFAAEPGVDLPAGATGQLWQLPSAPHRAGDQYYTRVRVSGSRQVAGKFRHSGIDIGLFATQASDVQCSSGCINRLHYNSSLDSWELTGPGDGAEWRKTCVSVSESNGATATCLERKAFPMEGRYYVTVRLSQSPNGWLHGRLSAPEVSITSDKDGTTTVDVAGRPVMVPVISTGMDWSELPASLQKVYEKGAWPGSREEGGTSTSRQYVPKSNPPEANVLILPSPSGKAGIEELEAWLPVVSDKATANVSTWGMRSLSSAEMAGAGKCITAEKGVAGIVTTNATEYSAGPPTFTESSGTLDYKVAAPHYSSGGSVFAGDYNLLMKSSVARCIYRFTDEPVSMSVSVVNSAGQPATATTSVGEKDGWLKLSATGFTHSSPTIRARLTQASAAQAGSKNVQLKKGKSLSAKSLASSAGLKPTGKSRITVTVSKSSTKVCAVKSGRLVAKSKGTCRVVVKMTTGKKKSSKSLNIKVM